MLYPCRGTLTIKLPESLMKKLNRTRRQALKLTKQTLKTLSANHLRRVQGGTEIQMDQQAGLFIGPPPPKETYNGCY